MAAVDDLREQGNEAFRNGDFLKAAAAYTRALKADPNSAVLYSNRSLALLRLNKLPKALADAEQCTKLDPANVKGWYRRAQVLETQGHIEQAITVLKEGSEAAPGDQELARQIKALARKLKGRGGGAAAGGGGAAAAAAAGGAKDGGAGVRGLCDVGGKAPASPAEAEALAFADRWVQYAQEQLREHGAELSPTAHFLPGSGLNTPEQHHPEANVAGKGAFADPTSLADFVNFLRAKGEELRARAVVTIVPKSQVAFPQMWLRPLWPYSREQDGVFVQLHAPAAAAAPAEPAAGKGAKAAAGGGGGGGAGKRGKEKDAPKPGADQAAAAAAGGGLSRLWFVRLGEALEGGGFRTRTPHELPQDLALLPTLLR